MPQFDDKDNDHLDHYPYRRRRAQKAKKSSSKNDLAVQAVYDDFKKLQSECHENHRNHLWTMRVAEITAIVGIFASQGLVFSQNPTANVASFGLLILFFFVFTIIELVDHGRHRLYEKILVRNQNILNVGSNDYILSEYRYWASAWEETTFKEKAKACFESIFGIQCLMWIILKMGIVALFFLVYV